MKLIKHSKYIYEYENFVDDSVCDEISNLIKSTNFIEEKQVKENINRVRHSRSLNLSLMTNKSVDIYLAVEKIHKIYQKCHYQYCSDNTLLNYISSYLNDLVTHYFYRYYDVNDYYDWHCDYSTENVFNIVSYILYLNDDFDGGNTLFLNDKIKVSPKKGSMLCFPCDVYHVHKSTKIKNGNKNIIWACLSKIMGQV